MIEPRISLEGQSERDRGLLESVFRLQRLRERYGRGEVGKKAL
jgi:hypothetical protein